MFVEYARNMFYQPCTDQPLTEKKTSSIILENTHVVGKPCNEKYHLMLRTAKIVNAAADTYKAINFGGFW